MHIARFVAPLVLLLTASLPAAAQSMDGRFGLGIEVPALDIRHVSQDISVPSATAGQSTTASVGQTTTGMGLFTIGAGLNGQYGLSNQTILGMRLALQRETSKSDGSSTAAQSQLSLLPRFEYAMAPDDVVRPHIGLEAGYERSTTNGPAGVTSNLWLIGPTGGVSYFPSPNWSVDVNASLYFVTGSEDIGGQSASTSGYRGILRVALSSWLGSKPAETAPATPSSTQSAAQPTPQIETPTDAKVVSGYRGFVQRELSIVPGLTLTLTTYPIASPDTVKFNLTIEGNAGAFAGCESLAMDIGGNRIQASQTHRRSRPGGFTAEDSLIGLLPVNVLGAASVQKGTSELVVCQRRWPLTSTHIDRMKGIKEATEMIARGDGLVTGNTSAIELHDDSVVTELLLSRDDSLRLEAKPVVSPYSATARFISRGRPETESSCKEVSIHADGSDIQLQDARPSRLSTAEGPAQSVEGNLTFSALGHIAAGSDDEVVDACGHKANVSPFNREQTWAFITQSVTLAKRLGVWRGFRAPPAPEPSPQQEPKSAPPDAAKHKRK